MAFKRKIHPDEKGELRITGVPGKVIISVRNIAAKIGVEPSSFLKTKLDDIVNSYSDEYRNYSSFPDDLSD